MYATTRSINNSLAVDSYNTEFADAHEPQIVYLLCQGLEDYVSIKDTSRLAFKPNFLSYLNNIVTEQVILFDEDKPRQQHYFTNNLTGMLKLAVRQDAIISVNSLLTLKPNSLNETNIIGAYLFRDSDQFFVNVDYSQAANN